MRTQTSRISSRSIYGNVDPWYFMIRQLISLIQDYLLNARVMLILQSNIYCITKSFQNTQRIQLFRWRKAFCFLPSLFQLHPNLGNDPRRGMTCNLGSRREVIAYCGSLACYPGFHYVWHYKDPYRRLYGSDYPRWRHNRYVVNS